MRPSHGKFVDGKEFDYRRNALKWLTELSQNELIVLLHYFDVQQASLTSAEQLVFQ